MKCYHLVKKSLEYYHQRQMSVYTWNQEETGIQQLKKSLYL